MGLNKLDYQIALEHVTTGQGYSINDNRCIINALKTAIAIYDSAEVLDDCESLFKNIEEH